MVGRWVLLCGLASANASAQREPIRATVPLVQVPVSVTDRKGQFVYGLTEKDFVLLDEGREREIRVDDPDTVAAPIAVVVLVQASDISDSALLKIKKVGSMIGEAVAGANGITAVTTYSDRVTVLQPFTPDSDAVSKAFGSLRSGPTRNGHMLDAIGNAVEMLRTRPEGTRSAIVVIGEGKDRGSETKLSGLLPSLQRSGATVYCLEYSAFATPFTTKASEYSPPESGGDWILDSITEAVHATKKDTGKILTASTGGRVLKFETKSKLENDLIRLGAEIHSRYMLSFTPTPSAQESFHAITIRVKSRPDLRVEARPGYWSNIP